MVNLENKEIALKATWPKILAQEKDYAEIVYDIMRCFTLKEDIWRAKLHVEDIKYLKIKNKFWGDVLISWASFNSHYYVRYENQILWYNSLIRIGGKPCMWNDAFKRGLKYVNQLFESQNFICFETMYQIFGITRLRYNSLKAAIPKQIKDFFLSTPKSLFLPLPSHN